MERPLTIGTREDGLARSQAEYLVRLLKEHAPSYPVHLELVRVGDQGRSTVHAEYLAENRRSIALLHRMLREEECDVVVHRGFDLRNELPADLSIAAIPRRSSPYDALLSPQGLTLDELEPGTTVGVVQLRARAQMIDYRDDLDWTLMTDDVSSWLENLLQGRIEALVMPNAAVEHLGLQERVSEIFPVELMIPAPCSGILVCVTRPDDDLTRSRLSKIHDRCAAQEYAAERAFMEALGCEWDAPVSALAQCKGSRLLLMGMLTDATASLVLREGVEGKSSAPAEVGQVLAELLEEARQAAGEAFEDDRGLSLAPVDNGRDDLAAILGITHFDDESENSWNSPASEDLLDPADSETAHPLENDDTDRLLSEALDEEILEEAALEMPTEESGPESIEDDEEESW